MGQMVSRKGMVVVVLSTSFEQQSAVSELNDGGQETKACFEVGQITQLC